LEKRNGTTEIRKADPGLVVVDPYNDFISEGGKLRDGVKGGLRVMEAVASL